MSEAKRRNDDPQHSVVKRDFTKETVIPNVPFEKSIICDGVYAVDSEYLIALISFYQRHTSV